MRSIVDLLVMRAAVETQPWGVCLREHGRSPETLSYTDLLDGARRVAAGLRAQGVNPGDRVAVILPTSRAFLDAFFGILCAGAIPVPIAPPFSIRPRELEAYEQALEKYLGDCSAAACITLPRLLLVLGAPLMSAAPGCRLLTPEAATTAPMPLAEIAEPAANDPALLQYTSGSTSDPKGVVLSHGNLLANVAGIEHALEPDADTLTVSWLPLYHDMGLIGSLLTSLWAGTPLVLIPPQAFLKDPGCWLRAISEHRATITVAPNFAFGFACKRLEDEDVEGLELGSLRCMLNGAEPVDLKLVERFTEKFAHVGLPRDVVRPVYGLAESSLAVAFSDWGPCVSDHVDADVLETDQRAVPSTDQSRSTVYVSVGRAIGGARVRIVDEDGQPLPDRSIGEIVVSSPSIMKGYYQNPDATARTLRDGWLHTGDLGYLAGGQLFITGRKKDVIIRRGKNYYPHDIEVQVSKIEHVRKGAVVAFGVEGDGDTGIVIALETKIEGDARAALIREVKSTVMASFQLPIQEVVVMAPGLLPKSTSGKVRRQPCKAQFLDGTLGRAESKSKTVAPFVARSAVAYARRLLSRSRTERSTAFSSMRRMLRGLVDAA